MTDKNDDTSAGKPIEEQAREQTGQQQVRLRIDEKNMQTNYANGFLARETAEEVILDFGLNVVQPSGKEEDKPEIVFHASERVIMNYYVVKRLALTLGQLVRRYEQQFGQLELDVAKRRSGEAG